MQYKSMFPDTQLGGTARRCLAEIAEIGEAYHALVFWHTSDIVIAFSKELKQMGLAELHDMDEARNKALSVLECMLVNKINDYKRVAEAIHAERVKQIAHDD